MDFVRIGKDIIKLFTTKDENIKSKKPKIEFKEYINANFDTAFFTKTLNLKPEEIFLFLEFCEADSKAKTIVDSNNKMMSMEFLIKKNKAFQKLD